MHTAPSCDGKLACTLHGRTTVHGVASGTYAGDVPAGDEPAQSVKSTMGLSAAAPLAAPAPAAGDDGADVLDGRQSVDVEAAAVLFGFAPQRALERRILASVSSADLWPRMCSKPLMCSFTSCRPRLATASSAPTFVFERKNAPLPWRGAEKSLVSSRGRLF